MLHEIERLQDCRSVLEKAIRDIEGPLHIAEECLYHREARKGMLDVTKRFLICVIMFCTRHITCRDFIMRCTLLSYVFLGTELVHDDSEKCLLREVENLRTNQKKLEACLDRSKDQV